MRFLEDKLYLCGMKKECLLLILLSGILSATAQFLHKGDTIAIISPSSATDTTTINGGIRTLEQWGYHCVIGKNALNNYHGFAGTIGERLSDLLWALREPSVKAIMCSRGGDGAAQYLQHYGIPVCYDFPVGHAHLRNFPLLTGAKATLEVTSNGVTLCY